jgi:hypothetical protein
MKKIILAVAAIASVAITSLAASTADARGFGRGFGRGFNTTAIVLNEAYWAKVRAERNAASRAHRSAAAIRASAIVRARAQARAEARAEALAAAKAKAAASAQARLAAQKAELARLKAENARLQQTASAEAPKPVQTAQTTPAAPAPVVKQVEARQSATGECKRFIPAAGVTISVPCS